MTKPPSPRRLEKGARRFLYLGRLSDNARRDVPTLISAFEKIAAVHGDVELALVGGGDRLDETRELARRSAARDRISLPGFDDPEKWFAWADCFVLPSTREGLSNALLEAMAEGLPCIANDIPPNREVLRDGEAGVLVPVGDPVALEAAMDRMIRDGDFAARFAEKAIRRAEETYSIRAVADRYALLYQREAR
jgi:glycosyltransferase involved in cell wall biosynthesis